MANKKKKKKPVFPKMGTRAAENYCKTYSALNRFSHWLMFMAGRLDKSAEIAHNALIQIYNAQEREKEEKEYSNRKTMIDELKKNRQVFMEIMLIRHVDNFLNYLSEILSEIFTQRPETLRSSEQVELSEVLKHESFDSLVKGLAERQVDRLSYSSFSDLNEFFQKRFGLLLFPVELQPLIIEAIETRNIATHNRCIINRRYCSRTGTDVSKINKKRELYIQDIDRIVPELITAVCRIDKEARRKLKIKAVRFSSKG